MTVTGSILRDALNRVGAVGGQIASFDELALAADGSLRQAPPGLTALGAASFLATMAQESDYFRVTEEYAKNGRYAPFIGRTFGQLTWEGNYRAFGAWCRDHGLLGDPETFVRDPRSLADYRWAWLGGVFYFAAHDLWRYANAGDHWRVSQAYNGGDGTVGTSFTPHGWTQRLAMFDSLKAAGDALLPAGVAPPAAPVPAPTSWPVLVEGSSGEIVWRLQRFLRAVFPLYAGNLDPGPGPSSYIGPATRRAVEEFQRRSGIPTAPPFGIGPVTWAALRRAGFRG